MVFASEDFEAPWAMKSITAPEARERLAAVLSRARPKELVHDYLDRGTDESHPQDNVRSAESIESLQQKAVERWREMNRAHTHGVEVHSREVTREHDRDLAHDRSHSDTGLELDL